LNELAQCREQWRDLITTIMNIWEPWKGERFLTSWATVSFSWKILFLTLARLSWEWRQLGPVSLRYFSSNCF
jgi:hypothetical protein